MSVEEENIVRYAAGFVPFTLLKRYERNVSMHILRIFCGMSQWYGDQWRRKFVFRIYQRLDKQGEQRRSV